MATVLIADDASFMRNTLKYLVEKGGHNVIGMAENGSEAIALFKELKPDLVTLDILMPDKEGIEVLKEIKQMNPSAKVIMITALGQEQKEEKAIATGAAGYIRKPFKPEDISDEVNKVLGEKAA